ncbi:GIY-YIG nuclease family protein [Alteromonas sp. BMJM2]|uniref:GIY-YIG nuclease family protein n=1 Tax=Alteromonas sp. BMJM2 TaxID=2954241 RepID=UPI0022B49D38|nr:GIY-YIG nuclease family protein [Alteromonas sp. BMJM2]
MNESEAVIKAGSLSGRSSETFSGECLTGDAKTSSTWYLYLIENKLGQLYTGITTDPKRRIAQHRGEKAGGARALRGKSPLTFRAIFRLSGKSDAAVLEYKIKKLTRAQKNQIIQSGKLELTNKGSTLTLNCIKDELIN